MAELGLQRVRPALVLLEAAVEALPAGRGQLVLLAVAVAKLEAARACRAAAAPRARTPSRCRSRSCRSSPCRAAAWRCRRSPASISSRHLAVEEGEHQGADVGAVDVGVGHQDDLVVAGVLEVELLADAGPDRGDQRLDLSFESTLSIRLFSTLMILPRSGSTACVLRSRPCFAEPPAESPSTMNSSASAGSRTVQSASLPGRVEFSSADLRRVRSRALRAAWRARAASTAFETIRRASARVLLEELAELAVDGLLDQALDRRVAELGLRLALELRVGELHRDHRGQALADVVAASGSRPSPSAAPCCGRRRSGSGSAPSGSRRGASRPRGC